MLKSSLFRRIGHWWNYLVVRWPLLLTVAVLWLGQLWLKSHYGQDDSNLWLVMNQFLAIIKWSLIALFAVSVITALMTWLFFIYVVRNRQVTVSVSLGDGQKAEAGRVTLQISLTGPVIRPLLGTIRARLFFNNSRSSETLLIDSDMRTKGTLLRKGIRGTGTILLYDRGIYDVTKVHILFCDMFNLIALPYTVSHSKQLYTLPQAEANGKIKAEPHAVEEQKFRIEIPKRIEGEYVNYKEFESGDNIRRIVWKIYAKSGQLVVRVPETKDPYASHLYFYISWFEGFGLDNGLFDMELLNVYKDKVRTLFEALKQNGYDVNIPSDQEVPRLAGMSDRRDDLFQITASHWQRENAPSTYVKPAKAAFVCLSSMVPASEVELLLKLLPLTIPVLVIKLSDAIRSPFRINVKDVFFKPEEHPSDRLRQPWLIAPLRQKLQKNENEIASLLNQRGRGWVTSSIEIT